MSFPASPTNGQQTSIGGVLYEYSTSNNTWKRIPVTYSLNSNTTTFANITVTSNVVAGSYLYANGASVNSTVESNIIHPFLLMGA